MMTVEEIRLENLKLLIKEFKTQAKVAELGETDPSYVSQVVKRVKSRTGKARDIGTDLARRLELGCEKPVGWMDEVHHEENRLAADEEAILNLFRKIDPEDRETWIKVGRSFAKEAPTTNAVDITKTTAIELKAVNVSEKAELPQVVRLKAPSNYKDRKIIIKKDREEKPKEGKK